MPVVLYPVVLASHGDLAVLRIGATDSPKNYGRPDSGRPAHVGEPVSVPAYPME